MHIGIIYNPVSGSGKSQHTAEHFAAFLESRGIAHTLLESLKEYDEEQRASFRQYTAIVIAGGDGTLLSLLSVLANCDIPIYMLPTGNESLFAREFEMSIDFDEVLARIESGNLTTHYICTINDTPFFTMVSIGFDSCVVQDIASFRKGPIKHFGYVAPCFRTLRSYAPPVLTVRVDSEVLVRNQAGFLVVSNNKQYALGMHFNPAARSTEQTLAVAFLPCRTFLQYATWQLRCLLFGVGEHRDIVRGVGNRIEISSSTPYPIQMDGEYYGLTPATVATSSDYLRVLSPADVVNRAEPAETRTAEQHSPT